MQLLVNLFQVIQKIQERLGTIYYAENVVLSATHTHSGPAGFLQYILFEVTSLGFVEQTFNAMVDGIVNVNIFTLIVISFDKFFIMIF